MAWYCTLPWIIAQAQPAADAPAEGGTSVALNLIVALVVVGGSFVAGGMIARALRMNDYSFKIGLVLFSLSASLMVNIMGWPPKRGIDLSGGVVLVYEVDKGLAKPEWMPTALGRLNDDLNAGGGEKIEARPNGATQIEIVVPKGADISRVERAVADLRRSADINLRKSGERPEDGKTVFIYSVDKQQKALDMQKLINAVGKRINPSGVKELTIRQYGAEQLEVIVPEVEKREVDQIKKRISTSGLLEFRIVANENDDKDIINAAAKAKGREVYIGGKLVGRWVKAGPDLHLDQSARASFRQTEARGREVLVRITPFDIDDGRNLSRASSGFDNGKLAVHFSFDSTGANKFGELTRRNLPDTTIDLYRHLGIILDDVILSAPRLNETIRGEGQITGNFTQEEVDFLVGVLNAGSLPATLNPVPISEQRVSSQLGDDTIKKGSDSIIISTAAILIFMAVYYRFCGVVADLAVVLNMVITVALMILIKAAFTLPGLAGLVLTVGMAVDANVLIYERMREETERGASLRMAIRNGFSRAMATIIDSHVTTLISAVVLYIVGTDQIKGFAVTLILGLLMSLYTAVFVSRVIFDIVEKKKWLTRLNMMHLIGHTNIDFIRWRGPAIWASLVLIAIGFVAVGMRGPEILDIDFTGGSSVQLLFAKDKEHDIADVRKAVEHLPDVAVSSVGDNNLEFKVDTSERDLAAVQASLQKAFGDSLQTYAMTFGPPSAIEAPAPDGKADSAATETAPGAADESKPAEKPDDKPADKSEKPAPGEPEPKADDPAKSEAAKSAAAGAGRTSAIQLASAGSEQALAALALAQDEPAAGSAPEEKKEEKKDESTDKSKEEKNPEAAEQPATPSAEQAPGATAPDSAQSGPSGEGSMVGGTRVQLSFPQKISFTPLRDMIDRELAELNFTNVLYELSNPKYQFGSDASFDEWTLEIMLKPEQTEALLKAIQQRLASTPVFPSSNQIGGKVAGDTQLMALYALLASMAIIVVYVWFRFDQLMFGVGAVVALIHDVAITVGFLAVSSYLSPWLGLLLVDPFKISLSVVAALLTIVGFSINDTIVVFDRIREVRGKSPDLTEDMINLSVNATLSRTLLTSGTVFIASIILYIVGGPGIHAFAYAMLVGVIAGTYSSIYIAAPILLWMQKPSSTQQATTRSAKALASEQQQAASRGNSPPRFPKSSEKSPPAA
jgi:SecD/SecF fusion protein